MLIYAVYILMIDQIDLKLMNEKHFVVIYKQINHVEFLIYALFNEIL